MLTIGMATYQDFDGVWATLQDLHSSHPQCQYMVIDNAPVGCPRTLGVTAAVRGQYLHRPDLVGTSAPRDAVFRLAKTPWVMCVDSHVKLEPGAVQALLEWIEKNPNSKDLIQGPMVYDDGVNFATHWQPTNPPGLWGTWAGDERGKLYITPDFRYAMYVAAREKTEKARMAMLAHMLPGNPEPFEIPMQGLGLFVMRKEAWPGFHPKFSGFGGEEGYIHEKVRQRGGRCICLPALRWRHRFRHTEHGAPPPPYRAVVEDHVWNLLIGHRELGVEATEQIRENFGKRLSPESFNNLASHAERIQPMGRSSNRQRLKLLGVWYTNNAAPEQLLKASLGTIKRAVDETMHHEVRVTTSSWEPIPSNPFVWNVGRPTASGHAAIIEQINKAIEGARDFEYDAIVFLEHDVLYPPGYFDRMGDLLATGAPVAVNLDYEGLNETGWLAVKERHEPMHQMAMRRDVATRELARAAEDCKHQGWAYLEPQGDRSDWARFPTAGPISLMGLTPAIHVNHANRFTSHGEVCYERTSGGKLIHPFWGDFKHWWPGEPKPDQGPGGCGSCGSGQQQQPQVTSLEQWFDMVQAVPSDFNEHMQTMRNLASKCEVAVELSAWLKPALLAMATGRPKRLISVCNGPKGDWGPIKHFFGDSFVSVQQDGLIAEPVECDLLFIDTLHRADRLYAELSRWAPKCKHWIVIHCTVTFGERGDDNGAGVLPAVRRYVTENTRWTVKKHHRNNNGLMILTCDPSEKKQPPGILKSAWNFAKAQTRHKLNGGTYLPLPLIEERLAQCSVCESRNDDKCAECGCYLWQVGEDAPVNAGQPGKTWYPTEQCPLNLWMAKPDKGVTMTPEEVKRQLEEA